jgi:hypothetical protein
VCSARHCIEHKSFREARALKIVDAFDDVPAPRLLGVRQFKDRWGVIMTRVNGQNFARTFRDRPEAKPEYMKEMASLHIAIHRRQVPRLPALKAWLGDEIQKLGATLPTRALLDRLAKVPDSDRLCHGDFHPANVSRHQVGHSVTNVNCDAGCSAMRRAASASASAFVAKVASGQGQYAVVASNEMTRQLAACSPSVNRRLPQARADCSAVACRPDVGNRTLVVHLAGNE